MRKALLYTIAAIASYTSHAQLMIGPEGGLNVANYIQKSGSYKLDSKNVSGLRAGLTWDAALSHHSYIQTAIMYLRNGSTYDVHDIMGMAYTLKLRVGTIEVPVNYVYKTGGKDGGLFVGGGLFVAYNIAGKIDGNFDPTLKIGSSSSDNIKAVDLGAGLNAGYQFRSGLFARASYQAGLTDLNPSAQNYTMKSKCFGITVGYLTGKAHKKAGQPMDDAKPKKHRKRSASNTED